jgi:hypothetical protein
MLTSVAQPFASAAASCAAIAVFDRARASRMACSSLDCAAIPETHARVSVSAANQFIRAPHGRPEGPPYNTGVPDGITLRQWQA